MVSAVESVLQPVQRRRRAWVAIDCHDIEAAGGICPFRFALQKPLCGQGELSLLAKIDAFQRATLSGVASIANFDEYYCIAVEHDQIKLAASA